MKLQTFCCALVFAALAMPAAAQAPKPNFVGNFKGMSPEADQQMSITRDGDEYTVRIQVKQGKCQGSVAAIGRPKDHHILAARNGACTLNMFRAGPNVQVEAEGCEASHGPECSFTNIYSPR